LSSQHFHQTSARAGSLSTFSSSITVIRSRPRQFLARRREIAAVLCGHKGVQTGQGTVTENNPYLSYRNR
jgi:hypothetical protein